MNRNTLHLITATCLLGLIFFTLGCDKLEEPYGRNLTPGVSKGRKVLLEEYTGHKCPNCPEASMLAHQLRHDYPEVILISIHAGSFAVPNPAGTFNTDFRTTTGTELNTFFQLAAYPSATINRQSHEGKLTLSSSVWEPAIVWYQDFDPMANLTLSNTFDTTSRLLKVNILTEFLENYNQALNLVVYLTEDSIVKPQYNNNPEVGPTPYITDYVHRHVLRASLNGTFGSMLSTSPVTYGTRFEKTYSMQLDTAWNEKQCYFVAFLSNALTQEVLQAEEKKIIP